MNLEVKKSVLASSGELFLNAFIQPLRSEAFTFAVFTRDGL